MALVVHLHWPGGPLRGTFRLPASKSESNRALILRALAGGGTIRNLSEAHDTQLLAQLLSLPPDTATYDCEDAGTTLRFLTAYLAVTGRHGVVQGTARMHERPIGPLVDALRTLGARIDYLGQEGYPPLRLGGFVYSGVTEVSVPAHISSQFISALMLVAPVLPQGLTIKFRGEVTSRPYLVLTGTTMVQWGIVPRPQMATEAVFTLGAADATPTQPQTRRLVAMYVPPGTPDPTTQLTIEADWSSAAFAYGLMMLNGMMQEAADAPLTDAELWLPHLGHPSLQADSRVADWTALLGLRTEGVPGEGVRLYWGEREPEAPGLDFTDCPDLAPAFIVTLAGLAAAADFSGLQSLRLKESDRLAALITELARFGTELLELDESEASLVARADEPFVVAGQRILTYHDHRLAMAFAILAMLGPLTIEDPAVVRKSFPDFWNVLIELGFEVEFEDM